MLTADQIEKITVEFFLGKTPTITGAEADAFREALEKDKMTAEVNGWDIEIPFDY